MSDLKYTSENLFEIRQLKECWLAEIRELNIQKRIIDEKIAMLYEHADSVESHICIIESQNKSTKQ